MGTESQRGHGEEGHVTAEAVFGVMLPQVREHQGLPAAPRSQRRHRRTLPQHPQRGRALLMP